MRFASFVTSAGQRSWGVLAANGKLKDLSALAPTLVDFLRDPRHSEKLAGLKDSTGTLSLEEVKLLACIPRPSSMRDGYAFRQHVEAARRYRGLPMIPEFDQFPTYYYQNHQSVVGPGPVYVHGMHLEQLDFELEAAIVVGKEGRNLKAAEADAYIFGYTIMNDLSARKVQVEEMKLSMGPVKGKDFATALGPWLVTRDELADKRIAGDKGERFALEMTASVNGVPISKGNLKDMTWTFGQILERVSYGVTLYPGDVIGSGTVGTGCFYELNPAGITNQWLKPGDKIICRVEGLGEIENTIVEGQP